MIIESKGPIALVFDVSSLIGTLDEGGVLSPLAWQFEIERDLVEKSGLTIISKVPHCPSLEKQYLMIRSLQARYEMTFADQISECILSYLRQYAIIIEMTDEIIVMVTTKLLNLE